MRIAITRLREKATDDRARCAAFGHECYAVSPLEAVVDHEAVDMFTRKANSGDFDCIFFTSALPARLIAPKLERWPRVIAIGPQTKRELEKFGIHSEILDSFYSRDFARYVGDWLEGRHVGIPRADVPNPGLIASIESAGGRVTEVLCYSLKPTGIPLPLDGADGLLFTSAMSYREAVWEPGPGLILIAIGDITAGAMERGGHPPHVVGDGSLEGTLSALNSFLQSSGRVP
ncbi:MAG: uroporphyrinogen-III synthase [Methanolinea sp.]|jgi:uroporphyrinogen-III synthase|nr:uroporphyrinogen-III synthase [Methanolinea sp.]